jgi:hypothetical protein
MLVNLHGKLNCKYHVGFFFDQDHLRWATKDMLPAGEEENLRRLSDAGVLVKGD